MSRTSRGRAKRPNGALQPKPVERVELHTGDTKKRLIAVIVLVLLACGFFAYGVSQLVTRTSGWTEIEAKSTEELSCAADFTLRYDLGRGESSATVEHRRVCAVYTDAAVAAYQTYHASEFFGGKQNLAYLNAHPNETLAIDAALYAALEKLERAESRMLFLAPVWAQYDAMAGCTQDYEAEGFDPLYDEGAAEFVTAALAFVNDPEAISLELFPDGKARLNVSEAYLRFAGEYEITALADFGWMKNAFIADDLAAALEAAGYVHGIVSSYDGFARRLDREEAYSVQIVDFEDGYTYPAAVLPCGEAGAIVSLRSQAITEQDTARFYTYADGTTRTPYVSAEDGLDHAASGSLTAYAEDKSCAELTLALSEIYVADALDVEALLALRAQGIESVFCEDRVVWHSEPDLEMQTLYQSQSVQYTHKSMEAY